MNWFDRLSLPEEWRNEVEKNAETFSPEYIKTQKDPIAYLKSSEDKMQSLLYALYLCDDCEKDYERRKIDKSIMLDSLNDIKLHSENYYRSNHGKKIGLDVIEWVYLTLKCEIYKLGRLQFQFTKALYDYEPFGVKKGEDAIAIHITRDVPLLPEECQKSYDWLERFLKQYFPDFDFKVFTAETWLLDENVQKFMKPTSNILKVMGEYTVVERRPDFNGLNFLFLFGATPENIDDYEAKTNLQMKVKEYVKNRGQMFVNYGYRLRKR